MPDPAEHVKTVDSRHFQVGNPKQFPLHRQLVTFAAWATKQGVCLVIIDETLLSRIPTELALDNAADINQMAKRRGAMTRLGIGIGFGACADAGKKVFDVR